MEERGADVIAAFGGSFDPLHEGHLHLAQTVQKHYQFEKFYFIPARLNPLKGNTPPSSSDVRMKMLTLALKSLDDPAFSIWDYELEQSNPSYTYFTIKHLKETVHDDVALIMGNDVFAQLSSWYKPHKLLEMANCVVITRDLLLRIDIPAILNSAGIEDATPTNDGDRFSHNKDRQWVETFYFSPLPFSSTALRNSIQGMWRQENMEHMPPGIQRSVWQVIKDYRLYTV